MLINLIVALVVVGVVLYLITLIPMDAAIMQIIRVLVIVAVLLYVLSLFMPGLRGVGLR